MIGLGVKRGDLTLRAKEALDGATKIIARTLQGDCFKSLDGYEVTALDGLFEKSRNFDTLNKKLATAVISAAKTENVCYCVDGSVSEDEACKIILQKHKDCEVLDGVSKFAGAYVGGKLKSGCTAALSAYGVGELKGCNAAVVYDIDCEYIAGVVKAKLSEIFGEEHDCAFVRAGVAKSFKIYEIDRQKDYSGGCAVAVEADEFLKRDRYDYADLEHMIKLLRAPGGCPWDRVQTPQSIKGNVIEEAYELVDAIERDDAYDMEEETGDVMLQAAFHAVMAEERGDFTGADALTRVVKKLIFRHSHIFGGDKAASESEALGVWDKNKLKEKGQSTYSETVLAVPKNFPACMRAQKVQKRAAKSGMDFKSCIFAGERLKEELAELYAAIESGNGDEVLGEAGDVLFSAVNVCRLAGVDCEGALRGATEKFTERFVECERLVLADGKKMDELSEDELDGYWVKAKNELKKH